MIPSSCGVKSIDMDKMGKIIHKTHRIWYPAKIGGNSKQKLKSSISDIDMHPAT